MKITFLGTGTSQGIPVISCKCRVCKSSNAKDKRLRVSVFIELPNLKLVIDSGPDFRYQMLRAGVQDLDAILYTHEHKDHIAGLDDIRPFNYLLQKRIAIYASDRVQEALKREFSYIFSEVKYPGLPQIDLNTITNEAFKINENLIQPLHILHHKLPIHGFRIGDFTYITDAKTIPQESMELIKGTKILVLNALQREAHISHFTLQEALDFVEQVGNPKTYFTHMSHNLGLHDEINAELPDHVELAYDGLEISL